jgi:glycine/D-amino acid oxidase-like deaminating enzyme
MFNVYSGGHSTIRRIALNDDSCGWIKTLPERPPARRLEGSRSVEWAVIGGGMTGLAAATRLAELYPGKSIALIDAQRTGECSAGRNSGFAIEVSPPRGISFDNADLRQIAGRMRSAHTVNTEGIAYLRDRVRTRVADDAWLEIGKIHAATSDTHAGYLDGFAKVLDMLDVPNRRLGPDELHGRLGTHYYRQGLWTGQAIQIQPAAVVRSLAEALDGKVQIYEDSPVEAIEYGQTVTIRCREGTLKADNVIVATNGLLGEFGLYGHRAMHLALTSCLTRPLTVAERARIGNPAAWGVLSVNHLDATVRYTADHRIMLRSTSEYWPPLAMSPADLKRRTPIYDAGLEARWPELTGLRADYVWSGVVAMSRNSMPAFAQLASNVFAIGICNASGISRGAAFGKLIVDHLAGVESPALSIVRKMAKPTLIPPRPFLDVGIAWEKSKMRRAVREH